MYVPSRALKMTSSCIIQPFLPDVTEHQRAYSFRVPDFWAKRSSSVSLTWVWGYNWCFIPRRVAKRWTAGFRVLEEPEIWYSKLIWFCAYVHGGKWTVYHNATGSSRRYGQEIHQGHQTYPEPAILLANDRQVNDLARLCCDPFEFCVLTVDHTFCLDDFDVTPTLYHHLLLEVFVLASL